MTVETQTTKITARGNGSATVFSFSPLTIFQSSDLQVTHVDAAGVETVLAEGTGTANYSVSVSSYPNSGSITYPASGTGKLATGETLVMKRVLPLEQTLDLENQGGYFPDLQETAFDKLVMICLQQQEELDRSVKVAIGSDTNPDDLVASITTSEANAATSATNAAASATDAAASATAAAASAASIATPIPIASGGTGATTAADARTALGVGIGQGLQPDGAGNIQVELDATIGDSALLRGASGIRLAPAFLRGYLAGLTLSNDGVAPNTKVNIAPGVFVDDTNAAIFSAGALSIDFTIVGAGGLNAGAIAANTWYNCFIIGQADGTVAGFASTSLSPALPAGYIYKRRLGSVKTDASAHILAFKQLGDSFYWAVSHQDLNATLAGGSNLVTLSVPVGVQVDALMRISLSPSTSTGTVLLTSPDENDQSGSAMFNTITQGGSSPVLSSETVKRTNTSGQVRWSASASGGSFSINTYAWIDSRGRLN